MLKLILTSQSGTNKLWRIKALELQPIRDKLVKSKDKSATDPPWLDPSNNRRTPYSDAELAVLAEDFIARVSDTTAWKELFSDVGKEKARQVLKERLAAQDPNNLVNWEPDGLLH